MESLVGVQLSDDIGEWVMDGVILCKVVNTLHPGMIPTIHTSPSGQVHQDTWSLHYTLMCIAVYVATVIFVIPSTKSLAITF